MPWFQSENSLDLNFPVQEAFLWKGVGFASSWNCWDSFWRSHPFYWSTERWSSSFIQQKTACFFPVRIVYEMKKNLSFSSRECFGQPNQSSWNTFEVSHCVSHFYMILNSSYNFLLNSHKFSVISWNMDTGSRLFFSLNKCYIPLIKRSLILLQKITSASLPLLPFPVSSVSVLFEKEESHCQLLIVAPLYTLMGNSTGRALLNWENQAGSSFLRWLWVWDSLQGLANTTGPEHPESQINLHTFSRSYFWAPNTSRKRAKLHLCHVAVFSDPKQWSSNFVAALQFHSNIICLL